ncbi:hypothetical protein LCGC14_0408840 [marine sediment metagenome]|uniref:Uncharacterized protein n=1 Tax=marine sediment metagenome TaxID=412755 RepID=A0A0F9TCI1_9ZZZZ
MVKTQVHSIEMVTASIKIGFPKADIQGYRDHSEDGLKDFSDKEIANILLEDIVGRYFNEEYFDLEGLYQAQS